MKFRVFNVLWWFGFDVVIRMYFVLLWCVVWNCVLFSCFVNFFFCVFEEIISWLKNVKGFCVLEIRGLKWLLNGLFIIFFLIDNCVVLMIMFLENMVKCWFVLLCLLVYCLLFISFRYFFFVVYILNFRWNIFLSFKDEMIFLIRNFLFFICYVIFVEIFSLLSD